MKHALMIAGLLALFGLGACDLGKKNDEVIVVQPTPEPTAAPTATPVAPEATTTPADEE